jgi:hypothetical protein
MVSMSDPAHYLDNPFNPRQDPRRRWLRCQYLLERRQPPSPTLDDDLTKEAWAFLRDLSRCVDDADRQAVARRFPTVAEAHHFDTTAEPLKVAEVQARLLADEDDGAIAAKCGLSPAAVATYHDLYYYVRPCLKAEMYIVAVVLGPKVHRGMTRDDRDLLLKVFGLGFGPLGVDFLLDYFEHPPDVPDSLDQLDLPALQQLRVRLSIHRLVLELTTPVTVADLYRLGHVAPSTARGDGGHQPQDAAADLRASIQAVLEDVKFLSQNAAA